MVRSGVIRNLDSLRHRAKQPVPHEPSPSQSLHSARRVPPLHSAPCAYRDIRNPAEYPRYSTSGRKAPFPVPQDWRGSIGRFRVWSAEGGPKSPSPRARGEGLEVRSNGRRRNTSPWQAPQGRAGLGGEGMVRQCNSHQPDSVRSMLLHTAGLQREAIMSDRPLSFCVNPSPGKFRKFGKIDSGLLLPTPSVPSGRDAGWESPFPPAPGSGTPWAAGLGSDGSQRQRESDHPNAVLLPVGDQLVERHSRPPHRVSRRVPDRDQRVRTERGIECQSLLHHLGAE